MIFMEAQVILESICMPSGDVVAREIEGEVVIVPLVAGIGDADDELYTLNETGQAIWKKLDGQRTLKDVAASLVSEYNTPRRHRKRRARLCERVNAAGHSYSEAISGKEDR
jgi:hypothetical protein